MGELSQISRWFLGSHFAVTYCNILRVVLILLVAADTHVHALSVFCWLPILLFAADTHVHAVHATLYKDLSGRDFASTLILAFVFIKQWPKATFTVVG